MAHPLFRLAAAHPQWLAEHALAYCDLLTEEVGETSRLLKQRLMLQLVGVGCLAIALVLAGVACMLWGAMPAGSLRAPWMLVVAPLVPAVGGLWALSVGNAVTQRDLFGTLRTQLADDAAMLRRAEQV